MSEIENYNIELFEGLLRNFERSIGVEADEPFTVSQELNDYQMEQCMLVLILRKFVLSLKDKNIELFQEVEPQLYTKIKFLMTN